MTIEIACYTFRPIPQPPLAGGRPDPNVRPWIWIESPEGEGMGMPQDKAEAGLRALLDAFWKENF